MTHTVCSHMQASHYCRSVAGRKAPKSVRRKLRSCGTSVRQEAVASMWRKACRLMATFACGRREELPQSLLSWRPTLSHQSRSITTPLAARLLIPRGTILSGMAACPLASSSLDAARRGGVGRGTRVQPLAESTTRPLPGRPLKLLHASAWPAGWPLLHSAAPPRPAPSHAPVTHTSAEVGTACRALFSTLRAFSYVSSRASASQSSTCCGQHSTARDCGTGGRGAAALGPGGRGTAPPSRTKAAARCAVSLQGTFRASSRASSHRHGRQVAAASGWPRSAGCPAAAAHQQHARVVLLADFHHRLPQPHRLRDALQRPGAEAGGPRAAAALTQAEPGPAGQLASWTPFRRARQPDISGPAQHGPSIPTAWQRLHPHGPAPVALRLGACAPRPALAARGPT